MSAVIHESIASLRELLDAKRREGMTVGLVPTMGALHEGHLSLIRSAREQNDLVVVSVFVNPTQFRPGEDFEQYPRQLADDTAKAAAAGCDVVFAPSADEIYPAGFSTTISVTGLTAELCGRPDRRGAEHFNGVTTVVAKLFNIVDPDRAYFGQKDAQQVAVINQMVTNLDFRVAVVSCPTVREADGLAMSSRNAYLSADERKRASALNRALNAAELSIAEGELDPAVVTRHARAELIDVELEYFEIVDAHVLSPVVVIDRPVLIAVAARVGGTRLIDNATVTPPVLNPIAQIAVPAAGTDQPPTNQNLQGAAA